MKNTKGLKIKKYLLTLLILIGLTGFDIALPTYTLKINEKEKDTFATKEVCEKEAKKRATCHMTFF